MQKKIIALAVAGLVSGVAFAQSNVTVYGLVDMDYLYSKTKTGDLGVNPNAGNYKFSGIKDGFDDGLNGSRVGFKGEEVLGNGLKALFQIELRVNVSNGQQTNPTRQSFVGLNSATLGTGLIGRQYNASSDFYGNFFSNSVTTVNPVNVFTGFGGQTIVSQGGNARQSNALKYISPTWSGFQARASYAFSDNPQSTSGTTALPYNTNASSSDNGRWSLSGDYLNGPVEVMAAYNRTSKFYVTTASADARTAAVFYGTDNSAPQAAAYAFAPNLGMGHALDEAMVGGTYDFKVVKIFGTYQTLKNRNNDTLAITGSKLWSLGAGIPVGNGKVNMEYAQIKFKQDNNPVLATVQDGGIKGFGLGYEYYLSKRTTTYAYYSNLKFDTNTATTNGANTGLPLIGGAIPGTAALGQTTSSVVLGLRHTF